MLTLNLVQKIRGSYTFEDLEITEAINVNGSIIDPSGTRKLLNPTLVDTTHIKSNANFKSLEVTGTIHFGDINQGQIDAILEDIVTKTDDLVIFNSLKEIRSVLVKNNFVIERNELNGIGLNTFLTKNQIEKLSFEVITGHVTIDNLDIHGLIDDMNIADEFSRIVKLNEDTFVESKLEFNNSDELVDIFANILNIGSINEPASLPQNDEINEEVYAGDQYFDSIKADEVHIYGDFEGAIEGIDFKYYDSFRLSISKDQNISGEYIVKEGHINNLSTTNINGVSIVFIKPFVDVDKNMREKLVTGQLHVNGNVLIMFLNELC